MITLKSSTCRMIDENNGGVTLYRVVSKVTDGTRTATFRRYRLIVSWHEMSDRNRRAYFRAEVNKELFAVLDHYETLQDNWGKINEELQESKAISHKHFEAYKKCTESPYGFWELYDFGKKT